MQVPKISFQQIYNNTKEGLRSLGEGAENTFKSANQSFDAFVSSKNFNPKTVKQIGLGAIVGITSLALVVSCIKGIVNSIKEKVNEK